MVCSDRERQQRGWRDVAIGVFRAVIHRKLCAGSGLPQRTDPAAMLRPMVGVRVRLASMIDVAGEVRPASAVDDALAIEPEQELAASPVRFFVRDEFALTLDDSIVQIDRVHRE